MKTETAVEFLTAYAAIAGQGKARKMLHEQPVFRSNLKEAIRILDQSLCWAVTPDRKRTDTKLPRNGLWHSRHGENIVISHPRRDSPVLQELPEGSVILPCSAYDSDTVGVLIPMRQKGRTICAAVARALGSQP